MIKYILITIFLLVGCSKPEMTEWQIPESYTDWEVTDTLSIEDISDLFFIDDNGDTVKIEYILRTDTVRVKVRAVKEDYSHYRGETIVYFAQQYRRKPVEPSISSGGSPFPMEQAEETNY